MNVWCRRCYKIPKESEYHINQLLDKDGNEIYDCSSDKMCYKEGVDGAQCQSDHNNPNITWDRVGK